MKKKKISPPPKLFVTDIMKRSWKEFCGERKMPRSPDKFLRQFLRITRAELQDAALIFRLICNDQLNDTIFASSIIAKHTFALEKIISELYDDCSNYSCRLRYINQMNNQIERFGYYHIQAYDIFFEATIKKVTAYVPEKTASFEDIFDIDLDYGELFPINFHFN